MKDKYKWGFIPGHKIGLLHRWIISDGKGFFSKGIWTSPCGLYYLNEYNSPEPNFTTEGTKCKKC